MLDIKKLSREINIADKLDSELLDDIGRRVIEGYEEDLSERAQWDDELDDIVDLALQKIEPKNFPWENASNIKYPLISSASIRFAAHTFPIIVQGQEIIKLMINGQDPTGIKAEKARRLSKYMNYQLLTQMKEWIEDMDRLLILLPIYGTIFKKTYFSPIKGRNVSELIHPKYIVVSQGCSILEDAIRITHRIKTTDNKIVEKQRSGIYSEISLNQVDDDSQRRELLEQHRLLDLDDDGYDEPYIVTVDYESGKVLRIVARYHEGSIKYNGKRVSSIQGFTHFTDFGFIPSLDGNYYSAGLGSLLNPLNQTINTLINQLIDAGTLANLQGGFLGSGIRIEGGQINLSPGEWRPLETSGINLKNEILPLPYKEPSQVLFMLLGFITDTAKDLASAHDIIGEVPANTPATTVMAMVEQGTKVYSAVLKRIYRSLKREFEKLYMLNRMYGDPNEYMAILDDPMADFANDFSESSLDVTPVASPDLSSETHRLIRAQSLLQLLDSPSAQQAGIDARAVIINYLNSINQENIEQIMPPPPPPDTQGPNIQEQLIQAQLQIQQMQLAQREREIDIKERESFSKIEKVRAQAIESLAKAESMELGDQLNLYRQQLQELGGMQHEVVTEQRGERGLDRE